MPHLGKPLTIRERQVLEWIGRGFSCKAIALQLAISPLTVRKHRSHIMAKAGLKHSAALQALAIGQAFHYQGLRASVPSRDRINPSRT